MRLRRLALAVIALATTAPALSQVTVTRGANISVDAAVDGRLAIDLRGSIWLLPSSGGDAQRLTEDLSGAERPRWSPNATRLASQASRDGRQGIYIVDASSGESVLVSDPQRLDVHPAWHPDGERIVYASAENGSGFDLWEVDVPTELRWRISSLPGDETEPTWSRNGRDLVFVHKLGQTWSLMLRRRGQPDEVLVRSPEPISSPSWRPDGSLVMYYQRQGDRTEMNMVILSQPRLTRTYAAHEAFDATTITWPDRQRMLYVANGSLRRRTFDAWGSRAVPFRAVFEAVVNQTRKRERLQLPWIDEPDGELIIRASRLFDGIALGYQTQKDIVIRGGRIAAVENVAPRSGSVLVDLGDVTVMPGFIDADARLPGQLGQSHGPDLLTMGVTTIVARHDDADADALNVLWSGKRVPGPRWLAADGWHIDPPPPPDLDVTSAVSTSRSTGRTAGTALPLQFRALALAGLTPEQSLRAVGVNAAAAMLADPYLGRIAEGAAADLLLVDGDPLGDAQDALNIVAVVRNGRFFSVPGLIDRAKSAESVE